MQPDQETTVSLPDDSPPPRQAPPPAREVFWSYIDLAWLIGIAFAGAVIMNLIALGLIFAAPSLKDSGAFLLTLQFFLYGVIYFGFFFIFRIRYERPVMRSLGWRASQFGPVAALITGFLLAGLVQVIAISTHTPEESPVEPFTKTRLSTALLVVTAVAAAPLFEEMLFRGFLQPMLTRDLGALAGVLITGALFGTLHLFEYKFVWQYGLAITIVGVALGYIRLWAKSIIPTTLVHACFNSISVFALVASKLSPHS